MHTLSIYAGVAAVIVGACIVGCGDASPPELVPYVGNGDPGALGGGASGDSDAGDTTGSGGGSSAGNGGGSGGGTGGGGGGGSGGGSDAGTVSTGSDPFAGASAYAATLGPSTLKSDHQSQLGSSNPAGHNCLSCHNFAFAGTVYNGTTPVSSAEVRVLDTNGVGYSAHTDANGNFYFSGGKFAAPAIVGVRDGANTAAMTDTISVGSCNNCHGSSTGTIQLP